MLERYEDWLERGSYKDSRLLHSDKSDRLLVYPSHLGRGYRQEILLREDLSLAIIDYTLNRNLTINAPGKNNYLKFEFRLAGSDAGYSYFIPYFGLKQLGIASAKQRVFEIEITFKPPTLLCYVRSFIERLPPQMYCIAQRLLESIYGYQRGCSILNTEATLDRVLHQANTVDRSLTYEQILSDRLYSEATPLKHAARSQINSSMKRIIGQILSCPYQGVNRRAYLEQKTLELVDLRLESILRSRLNESDLNCIYQAEAILRKQLVTPPTLEALARQVGTNRLKLNQGFHQLYNTTPFRYLRECRLAQARRLLIVSELAIEEVAATVGYTSRSHFAMAFRQEFGINPKAFQMQML